MAGFDKVDPAIACLQRYLLARVRGLVHDGRMVSQLYREMPARALDQVTPVARDALHRRSGVTGQMRVLTS